MTRRALLPLLLVSLLLGACDDVTGLGTRSLEGTWSSYVDGDEVRIRLSEDRDRITGSGTWGYDRIYVDGDRSGPDVYLLFEFSRYNPIEFEGTISGRDLHGWISGSGFRGEPVTFRRD